MSFKNRKIIKMEENNEKLTSGQSAYLRWRFTVK